MIREIAQNEGGVRAFYRGLTPNIIGNSTSWGIYFLCYSNIKDIIRRSNKSNGEELTSSDYFVASGAAGMYPMERQFILDRTLTNLGHTGILTAIMTNPIWVIKTRMLSTGSQTPGAYPSVVSGAKNILRSEGLVGFYRGLVPALFGVSHGALQFMAYEKLKAYRAQSGFSPDQDTNGRARALGNVDFFITSSLSKIFAGCITYPYQVLRSRLQTYDAHLVYRGVTDATKKILAKEGIVGFWKGFGPNLFRVLPSTWVTFLVYENTRTYLPKLVST